LLVRVLTHDGSSPGVLLLLFVRAGRASKNIERIPTDSCGGSIRAFDTRSRSVASCDVITCCVNHSSPLCASTIRAVDTQSRSVALCDVIFFWRESFIAALCQYVLDCSACVRAYCACGARSFSPPSLVAIVLLAVARVASYCNIYLDRESCILVLVSGSY